ncbi:MAG: glutathione S-transferase family protein [Casimicrobiaceae bacterium]
MYKLYIANKNYSSWSLRGWLATKLSGAPFKEVGVQLSGSGYSASYLDFSPSGMVPALHDGSTVVWDSLAIAEYLAEKHAGMWPDERATRAWARSLSAEMHSGFGALRQDMTMCVKERVDVRPWSDALAANIARVTALWNESRRRHDAGGEFLCGRFSIVDAFFAPVAFRFRTYGVAPEGAAGEYWRALLAHPWMLEWERAALTETTTIDADEPRVVYRDKLAAAGR